MELKGCVMLGVGRGAKSMAEKLRHHITPLLHGIVITRGNRLIWLNMHSKLTPCFEYFPDEIERRHGGSVRVDLHNR